MSSLSQTSHDKWITTFCPTVDLCTKKCVFVCSSVTTVSSKMVKLAIPERTMFFAISFATGPMFTIKICACRILQRRVNFTSPPSCRTVVPCLCFNAPKTDLSIVKLRFLFWHLFAILLCRWFGSFPLSGAFLAVRWTRWTCSLHCHWILLWTEERELTKFNKNSREVEKIDLNASSKRVELNS